MTVRIADAAFPQDVSAVRELLSEYERGLGVSLCFQGFGQELEELPGRYGPPGGALLLAHGTAGPLGCVAMRALEPGLCEMKRLFVRPAGRGTGVGKTLVDEIVLRARGMNYRAMRLDTLSSMDAAISLYRRAGFRPIERYYDNPIGDAVYLELIL